MGEEGEGRGDETMEKEKQKIMQLQSDEAQKKEQLYRLKQKKEALKSELDARQGELKTVQMTYENEQGRKTEESKAKDPGNSEDSSKQAAEGEYMRGEIKKLLETRVPIMEAQTKEEDEDDQGAAAGSSKEEQEQPKQLHDTVLVTYVQDKNQRIDQYRVTYRIDKTPTESATTVRQLHLDACAYWGCSTKEYTLYKINDADSKGGEAKKMIDLLTPAPGSSSKSPEECKNTPLVDGSVLDPGEFAILYLIRKRKDPDPNQDQVQEEPVEAFIKWRAEKDKAMTSKKKSGPGKEEEKKKQQSAKLGTNGEPEDDKFIQSFRGWPGVHSLLLERRSGPHRAWQHIHLRDIVLYVILAYISFACFTLRSQSDAYWIRQGVMDTLVTGMPGETSLSNGVVNDFLKIDRYDDVWTWLDGSFRYQLFNSRSTLRKFYTPVGRLRLRQQKTRERPCRRDEIVGEGSVQTAQCYFVSVVEGKRGPANPDTDQVLQLIFGEGEAIDAAHCPNQTRYAEDLGCMHEHAPGRATNTDPTMWRTSTEGSIDLDGRTQSAVYDGAGYMVDYSLQAANISNAGRTFHDDLDFFKNRWLDPTTRVLVVELTLANYDYAGFIAASFLIEITGSGVVATSAKINPFHLGDSDDDETATGLDYVRWLIVLVYILLFRVYAESKHKTALGKSSLEYVFSFNGFIDQSTVAIFLANQYMRIRDPPPPPHIVGDSFYNYQRDAEIEIQLQLAESIFFFFVMIRFATFMKISPSIFQFWKMFQRALSEFVCFGFVFLPVFIGVCFLGHAIWHPHIEGFSTFGESAWSCLMFAWQPTETDKYFKTGYYLALVWIIYFFLVVDTFFIRIFLAIIVHSYFEVQLIEGTTSKTDKWSSEQWQDWMLNATIYSFIGGEPGACKRDPTEEKDGEEGDEDEDDDDDDDDKPDAKR